MNVVKRDSTLTRPNDATQYAAGEVVGDTPGTRFTFDQLPIFFGEGGMIEAAVCITSNPAATAPDLELWLFDADVAATADNAAFAPSDNELLTLVGIITFPVASFKKSANNAACVQSNLGISFKADKLFGVLVVRNTYTPTNNEVFKVVLSVIR